MNSEMLLEMIGEIDINEVRTARPPKSHRRRGSGFVWAGIAAAAALAAALVFAVPKSPGRDGFTTERIAELENLTDVYDGTLLAENLVAAGAELSDIRLEHREDLDVTDASGWRRLTLTARRGEEKLEMTCTFDVPGDFRLPGEPDKTIEYSGVTVWLYISGEGRENTPCSCRVMFIRDGVVYDMELRVRSEDDLETVYGCLDMVLDDGEDGTAGKAQDGTGSGAGPTNTDGTEKTDGTTASDPAVAVPSLKAVLAGEKSFLYTDSDGNPIETLTIDAVGEVMTPGGAERFEGTGFTVVDMDGDGTNEAVVHVCRKDGDDGDGCFVVLRYNGGEVNGYMFYARAFYDLKGDGTFCSSDGAANELYRRLEFEGRRCVVRTVVVRDTSYHQTLVYEAGSPEEYDEAVRRQNAKPAAEWFALTEENIGEKLG